MLQLDLYTDQARRVVELAFLVERKLQSGSVGTESLLMGLMMEGSGVAFRALVRLGAKPMQTMHISTDTPVDFRETVVTPMLEKIINLHAVIIAKNKGVCMSIPNIFFWRF